MKNNSKISFEENIEIIYDIIEIISTSHFINFFY